MLIEFVAPKVGGVTASDGQRIIGHHKLGGAPSMVFDAVVLLPSEAGVADLVAHLAARDFVADATRFVEACRALRFRKRDMPAG